MARNCLQTGHVDTLDWSSRSTDRVRDLDPFPAATLPELERRLVEQWYHTLQEDIHRLLLSMRSRLTE